MHTALEIYRGIVSPQVVAAVNSIDVALAKLTHADGGTFDYNSRVIVHLEHTLTENDHKALKYMLEAAGWVSVVTAPKIVSFLFPTNWNRTC